MFTNTSARGAFTLIELLVVVAIISVLAGMLLPSLQSVRNAARSVVCQGQQRQIGMAFLAYADEHQGQIAPWQCGTYIWKTYVGQYETNNTEGTYPGWGGRIYPYLGGQGSWKIYVCPSDTQKRDLRDCTSNSGQGTGASYSMAAKYGLSNIHGLSYIGAPGYDPPNYTHTSSFRQLRWPSESCLIGDDTYVGVVNPVGYFYQGTYLPRHGDGVNAVFCDGHVERVPINPFFTFTNGGPVGDYTSRWGRFWNSW